MFATGKRRFLSLGSTRTEGQLVCLALRPATYEVIAPDTSSEDFAIAFCSSS